MRKLLYAKDSQKFWEVFSEEREKRRKKLGKLSFARKIAILEQMQADENRLRGLKE